jgi:hypothetical protein
MAYVHRAPLIDRSGEFSNIDFGYCIDCLIAEYSERRNLILRVASPVDGGQNATGRIVALKQRGFRRSKRIQTNDTFIVDLSNPLSIIRKNLDCKWRNHLSKAQRSNIHVTRSEALIDFDHFEPLLLDLMRAKRFTTAQTQLFFEEFRPERSDTNECRCTLLGITARLSPEPSLALPGTLLCICLVRVTLMDAR